MSFLTGTGGLFGGQFQAQSAPLVNPLAGGAQAAVNQSANTINQQQALANALAQAGGIQNQENVYNQLGQIAQGQGPNPAQAMLNQATGQNVANQAALMASQRGASTNPALIARQAAQQGANLQQQAVNQGATLQAQQALGALGQQAGIAGQQVGNQMAAQQALTNAAQNQAGQLIGANVAQNQGNIQNVSQQNQANVAPAMGNQQGGQNLLGNITGAVGSALNLLSRGGEVKKYADGGGVNQFEMQGNPYVGSSPYSSSFLQSNQGSNQKENYQKLGQGIRNIFQKNPNSQAFNQNLQTLNQMNNVPTLGQQSPQNQNIAMAMGGKVPALLSPGEKYLPPSEVKKVEKGEKSAISAGEKIKGKAKVPGDSEVNDTVPKTLKEGGIVLPRSVTQSKNPGKAAQAFVETLLKKQGKKV